MNKRDASVVAQLAVFCFLHIDANAGDSIVPIETPPAVASPDERKVESAERDACCQRLLKEGRLLKERFPGILADTELVSYSERYGYVLRYDNVEDLSPARKALSRVVFFMIDSQRFHAVIDYSI